jgi:ABC-type transporter Mla subunit MlaD
MGLQDIGLRARLDGAATYVREAQGMEQATNNLGRSLSSTSAASTGAAGKLNGLIAPLSKLGLAAAGAFAGFSALNLGKQMVKLAIDAVESENLFTVSMGKMGESASTWAKRISQDLGLYETEVKKFLGTFNVMLTSMGLAPEKAYEMSTALTQLAYDMASFYNIDFATAFEKLQSGISGEVEPLKRLGIIVNESTSEQAALRHGLIKTGDTMNDQQKVIARYLAIMDQTSMAQGDLARTADSPANALRRLEANFSELGETLGQIVVPALTELVKMANNALGPLKELAKVLTTPIQYADTGVDAEVASLKAMIAKYEQAKLATDDFSRAWVSAMERPVTATSPETQIESLKRRLEELQPLTKEYAATMDRMAEHQRKLDDALAVFAPTVGDVSAQVAAFNGNVATTTPTLANMIDLIASASGGLVNMANSGGIAGAMLKSMNIGPLQIVAAAADNAAAAFGRMAAQAYQAFVMATNAAKAAPSLTTIGNLVGSVKSLSSLGSVFASLSNLNRVLNPPSPAPVFSDYVSGASAATDAMQGLESAIRDCETAMRGLASVRLPGMQAAEDQMFEMEMAIKRARLGELGMGEAVSQAASDLGDSFNLLAAQQREIEQGIPIAFQRYEQEYQDALRGAGQAAQGATGGEGEKESDRLARELEKLQLMYDLAYQPQQRLLTETMEDYLGENIEIPLSEALRMLKEQGTIYTGLNRQVLDMGGTLEDSSQWIGTIYDTRSNQLSIEDKLLGLYEDQTIELGKQVALYGAMNPGAAITAPLPGLADGGDVMRGGMVRVGERGPETALLPTGTRVLPAGATHNVSSTRTYQDTYNVYQASQPWSVVDAIRKESALRKLTAGRL